MATDESILRERKKSAKGRLTRSRNQLKDLVNTQLCGELTSKNTIRRSVNKVRAEYDIIEKIINALKEIHATSTTHDENVDPDTIIDALDKELEEIGAQVDEIIKVATDHIKEREENGEKASLTLSSDSTPSIVEKQGQSDVQVANQRFKRIQEEQKQQEDELEQRYVELNERFLQFQQEQRQKEEELQRKAAELELTRQRAAEARKIVELNQTRADATDHGTELQHISPENVENREFRPPLVSLPPLRNMVEGLNTSPLRESSRGNKTVKLKGVDLPQFSGEDKADYESWKAAFMSIIDASDLPVSEKMLRLQNSLSGRALMLVKDLGYSINAYERAKSKLEKKYGGKRRLIIKHLTALRDLPKVKLHNLKDMENFLLILDRVTIALQDSGPGKELTGQNLNLTAKEKLSQDVQTYKYWVFEHSREDTFETLVEWVELRVRIMEEAEEGTKDPKNNEKRRRGFHNRPKLTSCIVPSCKTNHPPWVCSTFKALPVSKRKELISESKRCFRCLAAGHRKKDCPNVRRCGLNGCDSNEHSRYLHDDGPPKPANPENDQRVQTAENTTHTTRQADHVSLMVLPAVIKNGNKSLEVNVMLDNCSTGSYVSEAAAEELMLEGDNQELIISGTGGSEVRKRSRQVEVIVANLDNKFSASLQANVLDTISGDTPAFEWSKLKTKWPHLQSIPFQNVAKRHQIDVLIGSDNPIFHHVVREVHGEAPKDPIARKTSLGWVCFGPTLTEEFRRKSRSYFTRTFRTNQIEERGPSDDVLRQFWELEAIGIRDETERELTPDEKAAVAQVTETSRFKNDRYEIGIPWKRGEPHLVNNYEMALKRLKTQEQSLLRKSPEIAQAYDEIIKDYERKEYITKVPKTNDTEQWFLPHFPVIRQDRATTKVRIVFDAAAKENGKCLNDAVRAGPKLQRELIDVLTRFRRAPIALSGDISEMFLQVGLSEEDQRYHRFLWRNLDPTKEPDHYEFKRLLFGNRASPFCSQHVVLTHAKAHATDYPHAAETVNDSMYVDDVLDSCETVDEAVQLRRELSELFALGNFPVEDRLQSLEIREAEGSPKIKTLGVLWDAVNDVFTFCIQPPDPEMKLTKRNVLSTIATIFDPLQLLTPFTIRAKVLMQEIWKAGVGWDDILPDDLINKWSKWCSELHQLSNVAVPRSLRLPNPIQVCSHVFSDASKQAYGAVAYLVCRYPDDTSTSRIVVSKSRVSPTKTVTIPRLELMGAVIATRLAKNINKTLEVEQTIFWTDSTNVLYWIRNESREFKPFVANRIGEIHRSTNPDQWRHIPGDINPADLLTRGLTATDLANNELWMEGPEMIQGEESTWPPRLPNDEVEKSIDKNERRKVTHTTRNTPKKSFISPDNFSNFWRLLRVTGWVQRFVANCRLPAEDRKKTRGLSVHELQKAETYWLKQVQLEAFPDGDQQKSLAQLNPKDEQGLLRADGRLRNASNIPYNTRHPILLPKDHVVTRLIITDAHENLGHGSGVEHILTELRARFWIVKGRRTVRDFIGKCPGCRRRFSGKPTGQMMAPLPLSRVQYPVRAFARVGVDYGGPYLTKQGRGKSRAKRYLCLFTCLTTRAVHLEMSYSLDTDSFINALTRMVARRGTPAYMLSDNGTNFVGAERELRELVEAFDQEKIINKVEKYYKIEWKFNPPSAPHFGGVFEALIKSAKKAILAILGNADITDEELHTAICGAERLLNSRPIIYLFIYLKIFKHGSLSAEKCTKNKC